MNPVYEQRDLLPNSKGEDIATCLDFLLTKAINKEHVSAHFVHAVLSEAIDELLHPTGRIYDYDNIEVNMVGYLEHFGDSTIHPITITCEYKDSFRAYQVGHESFLLKKAEYGISWRIWTLPYPLADDDELCKWPANEEATT